MSDVEAGQTAAVRQPGAARLRLLAWLAEGAREVSWALELLPRPRWAVSPPAPARLGSWPALRHVRHLARRERRLVLPAVAQASGRGEVPGAADWDAAIDAADWDASSAEASVADLAAVRFDLLQQAEMAPASAWAELEPLLLRARQHELEHLAALWRLALDWDAPGLSPLTASPPTTGTTGTVGTIGVPLHPADRLEESH